MADGRLRIGVDGRELVGHVTGVGRYIGEVLKQWVADVTFPHSLVVFLPEPAAPELAAHLGDRVTWSVTGRNRGTVWEQWDLPRAARAADIDVFFAGAYTAPLRLHCPFVLVIHDVSYFAHPEWFSAREGMRRRWLTRASARRAHTVLTVSSFSADETASRLGLERARIRVAYGGAPALRSDMGTPRGSTVLYVGSLFNRRLVPEVIEAFARVTAVVPDAQLVLVGENRTHPHVDPHAVAASHGISDRVDWRNYVSDEELDRLYASARVFVFLSTYEGFALTPFEAIARGVPPVLLDTPVSREIYGDAACLVPRDRDAIAAALVSLLVDEHAHGTLTATGRRRLAEFTWARTAATVRTALESAGGVSR